MHGVEFWAAPHCDLVINKQKHITELTSASDKDTAGNDDDAVIPCLSSILYEKIKPEENVFFKNQPTFTISHKQHAVNHHLITALHLLSLLTPLCPRCKADDGQQSEANQWEMERRRRSDGFTEWCWGENRVRFTTGLLPSRLRRRRRRLVPIRINNPCVYKAWDAHPCGCPETKQ